jgi:mycofactocin system glycosyltransferase
MLNRRYGLAPGSRLLEAKGKKFLLSAYPLRRFEVNEAAWLVLGALDGRTPLHELVESPTQALVRFLDHKVDLGMLRASYDAQPPAEWPEVGIVVPAYGDLPGLRRCLDALAALRYPREKYSVTVVDDCTPFSLLDELRGVDFSGLTTSWLHLKSNMGPATARNAGAGVFAVPTPKGASAASPAASLLAFVDSDCVPDAHWLESLVPILDDPLLGAVGGGVNGLKTTGLLARYESACASLNMGGRAGVAGLPESRVSYLPSCNLIVKRSAFEEVCGFRAGMRLGEDVDFCWRLTAAGHGLFYQPAGLVYHDYRARWAPFLNRKRAYAFSESWLRRHHRGHFSSRGRVAFLLALVLAATALALRYPPGLAAALIPLLGPRMAGIWRNRGALRTAGVLGAMGAVPRGTAGQWLQQCRWFSRHTLVLWLPLLVLLPRLAPLQGFVFALGLLGEWLARKPGIPAGVFVLGFAGECLAYSLGRVQGELYALWSWLVRRR